MGSCGRRNLEGGSRSLGAGPDLDVRLPDVLADVDQCDEVHLVETDPGGAGAPDAPFRVLGRYVLELYFLESTSDNGFVGGKVDERTSKKRENCEAICCASCPRMMCPPIFGPQISMGRDHSTCLYPGHYKVH